MGNSLHYYIVAGYVFLLIQTCFAPKQIIPLAYDSGGVTTSTVTVPLIAVLGIGLASSVPGRSPLIDGFGLIEFSLDVDRAIGLESQMPMMEKDAKDRYF